MLRLVRHPATTALLALLATAACQDLPTGTVTPEINPSASIGASASAFGRQTGNRDGASRYVCFVSERTSGGPMQYSHGRLALRFPTAALAADGSTQLYRYRLMEEGAPLEAAPLAAANCRIPNTPEAVEFMNRRLGVDPRRRRTGRNGTDDDVISTMSCPKGGCVVEGVTAIGYVQPRPPSAGSTAGGSCSVFGCGNWDASYEYYSYYEPSPQPDPGTPGEPCNTGNAFLDDPTLNAGFDALWKGSNAGANLAQRTERVGWIVRTATGYRVQEFGAGNFCGWDGTAPYPAEGPDAVVGFIHTHPYSVGETIVACDEYGNMQVRVYEGEASDVDRRTSARLGEALNRDGPLAGLILDENGIRVFKGEDLNSDGTIARCGY